MWNRVNGVLSRPESKARLLFWMWILSLAVLLVGFGIAAWRVFGK